MSSQQDDSKWAGAALLMFAFFKQNTVHTHIWAWQTERKKKLIVYLSGRKAVLVFIELWKTLVQSEIFLWVSKMYM